MTVYFGEYGFDPTRLVDEPDDVLYWQHIVEQAVEFFPDYRDFGAWVAKYYPHPEDRKTAEMCWDLHKMLREL